MFDKTELKTLGMLSATVEHPISGKHKRMDFYVAATHDRAILGMKACRDMDLLFVNESNICSVRTDVPSVSSRSTAAADAVGQPLTKEVIVERYADLFTGVG